MRILLITQARISSSRLPAKVLLPLGAGTVLDSHLRRLKKSKLVTDFMVATTTESDSFQIVQIAKNNGYLFFQGSLEDVLDRFYQAASKVDPDIVVRVTSDCPLIDPSFVDDLIEKFLKADVDYASNVLTPSLPDGMDAEVFTFEALKRAWTSASLPSEREHVTSYIWKNTDIKGGDLFRGLAVSYTPDRSGYRLTLDRPKDYEVIRELVNSLGPNAGLEDFIDELDSKPELRKINSEITMNEGYYKSLEKDKKS